MIEQIQSTGKVFDAEGHEYDAFPVSMSAVEGEVIYQCLKNIRASQTLEIGLAYGMSTLHICKAIQHQEGARHIVIDPFQSSEWHNIGLLNLERAALLPIVDFHEAPSDEVLPQLCKENTRVDFALIDGSHLFDDAFVDFYYVDKLMRAEGIVCMDDLWMPAIQKVARFFVRNRGYQVIDGRLPQPYGTKLRDLVRAIVGEEVVRGVRRLLRRGRESGHPTTPLLFLRKPREKQPRNWDRERLVEL